MYMAGITEVRFCVFLPRSLACLNRISVYVYWHYSFILRYLQLCWHLFWVFNIYMMQPDRRLGNVSNFFKSQIYFLVFDEGGKIIIMPSIIRLRIEQFFKWKYSSNKSTRKKKTSVLAEHIYFHLSSFTMTISSTSQIIY